MIRKTVLLLVLALLILPPPAHAYAPFAVYGQADYSGSSPNRGGAAGPDTLSYPLGLAYDAAGGFYVADRNNHRVLYFAADGDTSADRVFGQYGNFNTNMANNDGTVVYGEPSADNLGTYVLGLAVDSQDGLYVADSSNHRVLYFANDGDTTAERVYGQWDDFTTNARNNDATGRLGTPSANSLNFPRGIEVDSSDGLYVADRDNNRVLYFANDSNTTADRVYGQYNSFTTNVESNDGAGNVGTPNANNLSHPKDIGLGPLGGLYISDTLHHRVLYYNDPTNTTATGAAGQFGSLETGVKNNDGSGNSGAASIDNLNGPQALAIAPDGTFLLSDTENHRVLAVACPQWPG